MAVLRWIKKYGVAFFENRQLGKEPDWDITVGIPTGHPVMHALTGGGTASAVPQSIAIRRSCHGREQKSQKEHLYDI